MPRIPSHVAYENATARLRENHHQEFAKLLDEERAKIGLPGKREKRLQRIETLRMRLAEETAELARLEEIEGTTTDD